MPLHLHNTLTKRLEPFTPADPHRVTFYTCGPTVYDYAHIGNFRAFLFADLLRRFLESPLCDVMTDAGEIHHGPRAVVHVMNMTDVGHMTDDEAPDGQGEDKMEAARKRLLESKKAGALPEGADIDPRDPNAVAEFYIHAFLADARALGLTVAREAERDPTLMPRPTHEIARMLDMIEALLDKGAAYIASDGVCYFDTQSFPDYGALSGNTLDAIRAGAGGRVSESATATKKHPADFMLWKPDKTHLMRWDPTKVLGRHSELREGYPGWHIECSAMAIARLGPVIDLHSGGEDNIFPHHECEIAQSRAATGSQRFARFWIHVRHLFVEGEKMSKSKGNFFTVRELLDKGFDPAAIRLELIKTHYRVNANFTEQGLKDSARMIDRWRRFRDLAEAARETGHADEQALRDFKASMEDDLNVAGALGALNAWINRRGQTPTRADAALLQTFDAILGALSLPAAGQDTARPDQDPDAERIEAIITQRNEARRNRNFAEADRLRDELTAMGVTITDTPDGTTWTRQATLG
jgi:cysteinyl-tRNA synthetase